MLRIPTVLTADELIDKAFRKAAKVNVIGARSKIDMIKQKNIAKVSSVKDSIYSTLTGYVKAFPSFDNVPPFYHDIIDLLLGLDDLKKSLGAIDWCAHQVDKVANQSRSNIKRTRIPKDMDAYREEMYGRAASLVKQIGKDLLFLNKARNKMRQLPTIDPEMPTIVVAGAPNVGKSQLVAAISTANPKVASYPFTTKDITVGLLIVKGVRYQVIDTPGLLDRPLEDRNEIEQQAIIALRHLANLVVFVLDPTGTCGYPFDYQLSLLEGIKKLYPDAKMIVIENKADLLKEKGERLQVSALTKSGVDELVQIIKKNLPENSEHNLFSR